MDVGPTVADPVCPATTRREVFTSLVAAHTAARRSGSKAAVARGTKDSSRGATALYAACPPAGSTVDSTQRELCTRKAAAHLAPRRAVQRLLQPLDEVRQLALPILAAVGLAPGKQAETAHNQRAPRLSTAGGQAR